MGINLFRGEQRREWQANKKLLCPFQVSFCVFSSSFLGGRYSEYLVSEFLMEGAAKVEKILSEKNTGVLLSWNSCESEQENVWFPSERSLGDWGLWLSLSLLGSKLLAFWSWCDDSVHSRLPASSPLHLVFAYSNCCRLQHFGFFHIFGVVFQRTWRCSKEVPLPLITKTNQPKGKLVPAQVTHVISKCQESQDNLWNLSNSIPAVQAFTGRQRHI